ncbi:MAG: cell division topological specificity factor MinE [Candidatus Eremiobacteraeota bacterium]|nr:cell division topological specificity factor MinE [Candidatus Eremiobacteraeota bacterium]
MIDLFNKLFGRQTSSSTAKERLRLVLLSDHLSLAPELVDKLKAELIEVLSRYVEVDQTKIEVNFEQQERAIAMMANVPILSMHPPKPQPPSNSGGGDGDAGGPPKKPRRRRRRTAPSTNPAPAT